MSLKLDEHEKVRRDILDIYLFIERDNYDAACRVVDSIDSGLDLIESDPHIGPRYPTPFAHLRFLRMLPVPGFPNYLIFYLENSPENLLRVLYVSHGARDFDSLFDEDFRR